MTPQTGGFLFIHSAPVHLTPHIRWAIENVMKTPVQLTWQQQTVHGAHTQRTELTWSGAAGTAGILASALRTFDSIFFEITEKATLNNDALRFMHTPSLGICTVPTDSEGNFTVNEDRIRYAFEQAAGNFEALYQQFSLLLGQQWDEELEPLRAASGHSNITRLARRV